MIRAEELLERHYLQALAQSVAASLPAGWRELTPPKGSSRAAAALLLRLAEAPTREAMDEELAALAARAERRARHRTDPAGDPADAGGVALWQRLRELLRGLAPAAQTTATLALLTAWSHLRVTGGGRTAAAVERPFQGLLPADLPARGETVTEAARILLRAAAREWSRREEPT